MMRPPCTAMTGAGWRLEGGEDTVAQLDQYYGLVKRQLLRYQSPTSHLYPDRSTNTSQGHLRDSIYCSAAVWTLYQVLPLLLTLYFQRNILNFPFFVHTTGSRVIFHSIIGQWSFLFE